MRVIRSIFSFSIIAASMLLVSAGWITDFAKAKEEAKMSGKHILLSFSGSDWCVPCIKTERDIFEKESFIKFADTNLILVNADFPRLKKNQLSKALTKQNEALAEKYDKDGLFPVIVLLNADGKVLKEWEGYQDVTPENFASQIKAFEHIN